MSLDTGFARVAFPLVGSVSVDRAEQQASARGHALGYLAGLREAAEESARAEAARSAAAATALGASVARLDRAVSALALAARELDRRTTPVLDSAHAVLGAAAVDIAEALVGAELCSTAVSARAAMARALAGVDATTIVAVRMNPGDLAALEDSARTAGVDFVADPHLSSGDAVTQFTDGFLDARIGTAVARVRAAIADSASFDAWASRTSDVGEAA